MGADGDDDAAVCDGAIWWDVVAFDEFDGLGSSLHASADTVGKAAKFVGEGSRPFGAGVWVFAEMAVLHGITSFGVDDGIGKMFW